MSSTDLVRAVVAYKAKRAEIKARQRKELDTESEPWAADVGDEIIKLRHEEHKTIEDIGSIIGIANRTFIYSMIAAAKKRGNSTVERTVTPTEAPTEPTVFTIDFYDNVAKVSFDADETYEVVVIDGEPDAPDEWADHTRERRLIYKDVLNAIRNHYKGA